MKHHTTPTAALIIPTSVQPSSTSSHEPLPSQYRTSTQVQSGESHQSFNAVTTSKRRRGSRTRTRTHSKRSQVFSTTIEGQPAADVGSQRPQATSSSLTGELAHISSTTLFSTDVTIAVATPNTYTGHGHLRSSKVPCVWPKDTNLRNSGKGRLLLTEQTTIVRTTITESFELIHASLMFKHAFPGNLLINKFLVDALSTAALHVPNAEDVHVRILQDHSYCTMMSALVCVCLLLRMSLL